MARRKRENSESGSELVAGYRASGLTRRAYCEGLGIPVSTLDYHVRRESERERKQARLLPVEWSAGTTASPLTLLLRDGLRLEVGANFEETTLRRLLAVLA